MRTTPIGIVMLTDERPHVYTETDAQNMAVVNEWARIIREKAKNCDGSSYEVVCGSEIVHDIRSAQKVGEELSKSNIKQLIMCYNVWNFPFLAWPLVNSISRDLPILSLSNNNGEFPGNVGLLATDGALRQAGFKTHRIIGEIDDAQAQANVIDWARASEAVTTIKNEVYGCYGGHSMGMETGFSHLTPTIKALGTTVRQIDQLWLTKVMEQIDDVEVEKGLSGNCHFAILPYRALKKSRGIIVII